MATLNVRSLMYVVPVKADIVVVDKAFHSLGDVNWDGVIDGSDADAVKAAFGSVPGDAKWNPDADLNGDGKIDLKDYFIVSKNMGKTAPLYKAPTTVEVVPGEQIAVIGRYRQQKLVQKVQVGLGASPKLTFIFTALGIFGRAIRF